MNKDTRETIYRFSKNEYYRTSIYTHSVCCRSLRLRGRKNVKDYNLRIMFRLHSTKQDKYK